MLEREVYIDVSERQKAVWHTDVCMHTYMYIQKAEPKIIELKGHILVHYKLLQHFVALIGFVHELCVKGKCPKLHIIVNVKKGEHRDADHPALEAKVKL